METSQHWQLSSLPPYPGSTSLSAYNTVDSALSCSTCWTAAVLQCSLFYPCQRGYAVRIGLSVSACLKKTIKKCGQILTVFAGLMMVCVTGNCFDSDDNNNYNNNNWIYIATYGHSFTGHIIFPRLLLLQLLLLLLLLQLLLFSCTFFWRSGPYLRGFTGSNPPKCSLPNFFNIISVYLCS